VQSGEDVLALFSQREPLAQFGAGEDRASRVDARRPLRLAGDRPQLMHAEIHLVGDIAQVAATAGGTAIVHLERRDDAVLVDLDRLRILSADVEHRSCRGEHGVGAQAVAQDLGADLFLGEGQRAPAVARACAGGLLERHGRRLADELCQSRILVGERDQRGDGARFEVLVDGGQVLHHQDRLVEQAGQAIETQLLFGGDSLGQVQVAAAGQIAKEVALALGLLGVQLRGFGAHLLENLVDGGEQLGRGLGSGRGGYQRQIGGGRRVGFQEPANRVLESIELRTILLLTATQLDPLQHLLQPRALDSVGCEPAREQGETGVEQGFTQRDIAGHGVVAAAVGDTATEDLAVLTENHGLGRR